MVLFWKSKNGRLSSVADSSPLPQKTTTDTPLPQTAPIFDLPIEIIQHIAAYLEPSSAASFCLSARYICYAVGTEHLATFLQSGTTKIERRKNIEIIERAFPTHWYCAWCDQFHEHERNGGPSAFFKETKRDCAEFNSYLHAGKEYVVTYHHVRLAMNQALWGPDYGISLDAFRYDRAGTTKVNRFGASTSLSCEAKMVSSHLLLHCRYSIMLPPFLHLNRNLVPTLWVTIPQIVVGHRDSPTDGHSGLKLTTRLVLAKKLKEKTQLCSTCATDYLVHCESSSPSTPSVCPKQVALTIETWRDLGSGRNPFEASWRAHGEIGDGAPGFGLDMVRLTGFQAGDIRRSFEEETRLRYVEGDSDPHLE